MIVSPPQPARLTLLGTAVPVRLLLPALLAAAFLLALGFLEPYQNWGDDWAGYMLQARSLLDGRVAEYVTQNGFMMREARFTSGPDAYPWGLPLLLAAESRLFGFDLRVFQLGMVACYLGLIWALYRLGRLYLTVPAAFSLAAAFAFHPLLLHYCNHILTEIPFTLLTVAAFLAAGSRLGRRPAGAGLAGLLAFGAFLFRTNGVLVLPALSFATVMSPEWPALSWPARLRRLGLPYAVFGLAALAVRPFLPGGGESHLALLSRITRTTLLDNLATYPVAIFDFFTGGRASLAALILLGPVAIYGAWVSRRRTLPFSVYLLASLAAFVLWPAGQSFRFMLPLTPYLVLLLLSALPPAGPGFLARRIRPAALIALPAIFALATFAILLRGGVPPQEWHPYDSPSRELFSWVRSHTGPNEIVGFFKPRAMHLFGGRLSLSAQTGDLPRLDYLVWTRRRTIWNPDQPPLADYELAASLQPVFENENFRVFRVLRRAP